MIEAVNSSIASTQVLRGNAEQLSTSRVAASFVPPVAVSEAPLPPKAPYISPYISIDLNSNKAVLQIRDSDTGEVEQQFPTKSRLAQLSQLQAKYENTQSVSRNDIPSTNDSDISVTPENNASSNIITVQEITSSEPSNSSLPSSQIVAAALSTGAQSGQNPSSSVSVLA